ncbi:Mediator of RNA polymerase II transcription subunit 13 [Bienertia sinuspersici]
MFFFSGSCRKGQPTIEFVFAASEDAIFVHAILSAKNVRTLSGGDMEKVLKLSSSSLGQKLPVIVSPHGMCGKVTGCCSSDLVKQVFVGSGTSRTSTGLVGLPYPVAHTCSGKLRGQNYYLEVTLGCSISGSGQVNVPNSYINRCIHPKSASPSTTGGSHKVFSGEAAFCEKTFIYPSEAVLVPVFQTSYARSSLKRFWLPNWTGLSLAGSILSMHCSGSDTDNMDDSWSESDGIITKHALNSSSNSNSSSISSISSSSSDSDYRAKATSGDLEADADSLTGRHSGLSSVDPMEANGLKQGSKRPRTGADDSYAQAGSVIDAPAQDYSNSGILGVSNDQIGSHWDWDGDDSGMGMDIQALLSEFGDFGDFFEDDTLPFGEPPGTAESQALAFSGQECGDGGGSPSGPSMDAPDQMLLPAGLQMFESFHPPPTGIDECVSTIQEATKITTSCGPVSCAPAISTGEVDHVLKAEASLTFAPEYGAVVAPTSELSSTVFRSPYQPKSHKAESLISSGNNYVYGATPPSSPGTNGSEDNVGVTADSRIHPGKHDISSVLQKLYTPIEAGQTPRDTKSVMYNKTVNSSEGASLSLFSGFNSVTTVKSVENMIGEVANSAKHLLLSQRTVPAVELECLMFQAFMCKIRHTLLSFGSPASIGWNKSVGNMGLEQLPGDPSNTLDNITSKPELRKKDSIPVRIAGDFDGGMLDCPFNAPIGVWRSVGTSKTVKHPDTATNEVFPSLSHHKFNEEAMISYQKRHPLQDFLDAIPFLVQQAASFVDVAFDGEYVDGPYSWLALQEQRRRGFCCGPHMVHAGCGGILASCHSYDIAGVDLPDPVSADAQASSVISLLQSDVKTALKSAFGTSDGPLSVTDWCKGRSQSTDAGNLEAISAESTLSECRESSNTSAISMGDSLSPSPHSSGMPSGLRDGAKGDDACQRRSSQEVCMSDSELQLGLRKRPTLFAIPYPSVLVGYQDDWLKTSANSLQLWEKAPLEPYAFQKHVSYYVVCPNLDSLTATAADFFQELGSVYETCKLGSHSPCAVGNQMDVDSGKCSTSGFVLFDVPQSTKVESSNASVMGSISDYYLSLSSGWDLVSYLKSLTKILKTLQLGSCLATIAKEGNNCPCTVIYVVCPFPDPTAALQTIVESAVSVASVIFSSENDKRAMLRGQVGKALSHAAGVDEASISNIPALSGFSIPRLVLQIVPIDAIFRVTSPNFNELVTLKELAFTVYNKARRISRGPSNDFIQSLSFSGRSPSMLVNVANPIQGMWKDCVGSRISGPSLSRETELDPSLRSGTWDNAWQTARAGGLGCDANRSGDFFFQEEVHYMFEPLFILAEPGSVEQGVSPAPVFNVGTDDKSGGLAQSSSLCGDTGPSCQLDGSEGDGYGSSQQRSPPSLHCCYGWTEDWRWLVCIWTDSRGEMLDNHIFPFGGISSRQDTKGMQNLFVQVLQQGCQLLQACASPDNGVARARDFIITRIGSFYELECQEWQKALYSIGGSEVKKWPLQLRRATPDGLSTNSNGASLQQQEMERSLPSSPNPLYSPHSKSSAFMKGGLGQTTSRKQLIGGPTIVDGSRGSLQWVQSISFVSVSVDHSLQLVSQADVSTGSSQGILNYIEGFTPVRSLGSTSASYILIPSPSMRFLNPSPLQLPTCLTSESPPLAHLLHSKGYAMPLSTGFAVSKAVPSLKKDINNSKEDWPSVLAVSLVDFYGGNGVPNDKLGRALPKQAGRGILCDAKEYELEIHLILESVMAELHSLSWMTASPAYLDRRTALPFHCDMVLRLRRLLYFAEKEISHQPEK